MKTCFLLRYRKTLYAFLLAATMILLGKTNAATTKIAEIAQEISNRPAFLFRLVWISDELPPEHESQALWDALQVLHNEGIKPGIARLEQFVSAYPVSAWTPSLESNLGLHYRRQGRYSLALQHWESAWELTRSYESGQGKAVGDMTLAYWTPLLASLGRVNYLTEIMEETKYRDMGKGAFQARFGRVREAFNGMIQKPGISYGCGTFALGNVLGTLGIEGRAIKELQLIPSPKSGFSMDVLAKLAGGFEPNLVAVRRVASETLIVPSVVHWKLDHYAAIVRKSGDYYEIKDPTFGKSIWMSSENINAEASGNFMIPSNQISATWVALTENEQASIFGRGKDNSIDDEEDFDCLTDEDSHREYDSSSSMQANPFVGPAHERCMPGAADSPTCEGMPVWRIAEPYINLWIRDKPLFYTMSSGLKMALALSYKQRNTHTNGWFSGVGANWETSLGSYLQEAGLNPELFAPGGGVRTYVYNGSGGYYTQYQTHSKLTLANPSPVVFQIEYPNRAINTFDYAFEFDSGITNYYLTKQSDPYGRVMQFDYTTTNSMVLLTNIVDFDGKSCPLSYTLVGGTNYLLTSIQDPYGRMATLAYDSDGMLTNITDMAGLESGFVYDSQGLITDLITPYGTTSFSAVTNSFGGADMGGTNQVNRSLLVTETGGRKHLFIYRDDSSKLNPDPGSSMLFTNIFASSELPNTFPIVATNSFEYDYRDARNSFHWGPKQYAGLSSGFRSSEDFDDLTLEDYALAHVKHWLHNGDNAAKISDTISWERTTGPGGTSDGAFIFYDYDGKGTSNEFSEGSESLPRLVAYFVPDSPSATNSFFTYFERNEWGNPTKIIDTYSVGSNRLYRTNTFVYDSNGRSLLHHYGPSGTNPWSSFSYSNNLLINATNRSGDVTSYTYDAATKNVATITFPNDLVLENELYSSGDYESWIKNIFLRTADSAVYFSTNTFTYNNGKIFTQKDSRDLVITNSWDNLQRLTGVAFPDGTTLSNRYDLVNGGSFANSTGGSSIMDLTATKDRLGKWTYLTWNALRQVTAVTNAIKNVTGFDYCECGLLSSVTDTLNKTTTFNYDDRALLTSIDYPDGHSVTNSYNLLGWQESSGDSLGTVTNTFNLQGLITASDNALGEIFSVVYDIEDRPTEVTDANGVQVDLTYDDLGRIKTRVYPDDGTNTFGYTPNIAAPTSFTDPMNNVVLYAYDALERLTNQVFSGYATNKFTYRPSGEIATLTDGENQTTTWAYDIYGRLISKVDASSSTILTNGYDSSGRLTGRWTPEKGLTSFTYDDVGNLKNVDHPTSADLSFAYDAANRLTNAVVAGSFTNSYTFTETGSLKTEDGPWTDDTVTYSYTNELRKTLSLLQPSLSAWTNGYSYDAAKRLETVISQAGTFDYTYDSTRKRQVKKLDLVNGLYITNSFDSVARLSGTKMQYDVIPGSASALNSHTYTNNAAGEITRETRDWGLNWIDFTYDSAGQLLSALGTDSAGSVARGHEQFRYAYDAAGNLTVRTNNALVQTFTLNSLNQATNVSRSGTFTVAGGLNDWVSVTVNGSSVDRVHDDLTFSKAGMTLTNSANSFIAVVGPDSYGRTHTNSVSVTTPSSVDYSYDDNGNLTGDGTRAFSYDDENELIAVEDAGSWKVEYEYDALGRRRIRKEYSWNGSGWDLEDEKRYIYDGRLVIQERNGSNGRLVSYTRGLDLSGTLDGAGGIGGLIAQTDHSGYSLADSYYHHDGRGNVTVMANSQRQVVARYLYEPYGTVIGMSGWRAEGNSYRFSGKDFDATTGLYYYGFRFYEPNLQRWLNQDPLGESGGINLYGFAGNDPVNGVDPFGLKTFLLLVGEDKSDLFKRVAPKWAKVLERSADFNVVEDRVVVSEAYDVRSVRRALITNKDIGYIGYLGHGGPGVLYLGVPSGEMFNLSFFGGSVGEASESTAISFLPKWNLRKDAVIDLFSCNSTVSDTGGTSIAQAFADYFGVPVQGAGAGVSFNVIPKLGPTSTPRIRAILAIHSWLNNAVYQDGGGGWRIVAPRTKTRK